MRSSRLLRATLLAAVLLPAAETRAAGPAGSADDSTHSPIRHVIVIIGENRSFDHVFATYAPVKGESVWNLLSQGIVRADGKPGPNFARAQQQAASDPAADAFLLSPPGPRESSSAPSFGSYKAHTRVQRKFASSESH